LSQLHEHSQGQKKQVVGVHSSLPIGVILIAVFYLFGAGVLLFNLFTSHRDQVSSYMASVYSLSSNLGIYPFVFTIVIAILVAVGLLTLSRWGLYLTIIYSICFGSVSCFLMVENASQPYYGNFIWSLIVFIYLLIKRKKFYN